MNLKKTVPIIALVSLWAMIAVSCSQGGMPTTTGSVPGGEAPHLAGWTEETHGNGTDPNYRVVFPEDNVNQIKVTISPDDWATIQANIAELFGGSGAPQRGRQPGERPDEVVEPGQDGVIAPRAPGIPGWLGITRENPLWVPATIEFNDLTWTNVGFRYKGNSSLMSGWRSGSLKLPFKLDFDEFEDEYPEITNQRFYGFKQLSFSNAFRDATYMRDALAADILKDAGLAAAETAYYEVIMDYGEGEINLGLYVAIEVVDDTVIESYFGDDSGNIYEAEGPAASLAEGIFNQIQASFLKENNAQEADWSDIEELYATLHAESRTTDAEAWRESLEAVFDVDAFLKWLAISAIIQHWDTYGAMSHNFYLYHDPDTGRLTWISWDHNQVLEGEAVGGREGRPGGIRVGRVPSLDREETTGEWPLIRYLLDDPVYHERYLNAMAEVIDEVFIPDEIETKCQKTAELITPYIAREGDTTAFQTAFQDLTRCVYSRYEAASNFLATWR